MKQTDVTREKANTGNAAPRAVRVFTVHFMDFVTYATWEAATATAVTLSGGNLVATSTGTTSADQGARVAAASGKTTGKYYFEVRYTVSPNAQGDNRGVGICTTASTYTGMGGSNGVHGNLCARNGGGIVEDGTYNFFTIGAANQGDVIGAAVDLTARAIWFTNVTQAVGWNGGTIGSQNPSTGAGGRPVPPGTMVPLVTFGGFAGVAGQVSTANFGASAFSGAVPSGFTAGWPA